jgi:N-acetylmuramoyl-L-alanine amidase
MDMSDGDPDKEAGFAVLRKTHMMAVLFELEFIHTAAGEAWLRNPANQSASARALAAGVRKHFGISTSNGKA